MKLPPSLGVFLEYLRLLIFHWRILLLLLLEIDNVLLRVFNFHLEIPISWKWILALLIVVWSGFSVYRDINRKYLKALQKIDDHSKLNFSLDLSFLDGTPYQISLSEIELKKRYDFEIELKNGRSVSDANDTAEISELPEYIIKINGILENDGEIPIRLIDLRFDSKENVREDDIIPFDFGQFSVNLSSRAGSTVKFPVRLDPGDLIYFTMYSLIYCQMIEDGRYVTLTPVQVASRLRYMGKNSETRIMIRGEFEDFDGQKTTQIKKSILTVNFRTLKEILISYWERHHMQHLLDTAKEPTGRWRFGKAVFHNGP